MDTPGAKELLGMIKRLETLAKERIALAEAGTTVPVLDDAATEMIRSVKEALADNRLAGRLGLYMKKQLRGWLLTETGR